MVLLSMVSMVLIPMSLITMACVVNMVDDAGGYVTVGVYDVGVDVMCVVCCGVYVVAVGVDHCLTIVFVVLSNTNTNATIITNDTLNDNIFTTPNMVVDIDNNNSNSNWNSETNNNLKNNSTITVNNNEHNGNNIATPTITTIPNNNDTTQQQHKYNQRQ